MEYNLYTALFYLVALFLFFLLIGLLNTIEENKKAELKLKRKHKQILKKNNIIK